ncbi:uncharacterized protein DS421_8g246490 [Arachis hypogaea]|nr:uncharacterized protein DS421_8g246490 [Arachis hypogaea]
MVQKILLSWMNIPYRLPNNFLGSINSLFTSLQQLFLLTDREQQLFRAREQQRRWHCGLVQQRQRENVVMKQKWLQRRWTRKQQRQWYYGHEQERRQETWSQPSSGSSNMSMEVR